jgi:hypothetical protein
MANAKESENRAADIIKNWIRTRLCLLTEKKIASSFFLAMTH